MNFLFFFTYLWPKFFQHVPEEVIQLFPFNVAIICRKVFLKFINGYILNALLNQYWNLYICSKTVNNCKQNGNILFSPSASKCCQICRKPAASRLSKAQFILENRRRYSDTERGQLIQLLHLLRERDRERLQMCPLSSD